MDAHDGFKPAKGHAGVAIFPGTLAIWQAERMGNCSRRFLEAFVVGYEIACRTAIVQHRSCADYHASGSWNSLGTAAAACRVMKLNAEQTRHALGIAEYFGPRSQMMRVIDHPTMLKDSSSWGATSGVTGAYLAAAGFTGAPAITQEAPDVADIWSDLGSCWRITEQYFKLWPICRWAQPAVEAALSLASAPAFDDREIRQIEIHTFHEACRLASSAPQNTEEAQYAIAFPTACALVRKRCGYDEVAGSGLQDERIRQLAGRIQFRESAEFNAAFPAKRFSQLVIAFKDGRILKSPVTEPPGDPEHPLDDAQLVKKFFEFSTPTLGQRRAEALREAIGPLDRPEFDLLSVERELGTGIAAASNRNALS
jgi:2-methylcitrate dehydratase PrpD